MSYNNFITRLTAIILCGLPLLSKAQGLYLGTQAMHSRYNISEQDTISAKGWQYAFDVCLGYNLHTTRGGERLAVQAHLQSFARERFNHYRIPVKAVMWIPQRINGSHTGLLDLYMGAGYYINRATRQPSDSSPSGSSPRFWTHGMLLDLGLRFPIIDGFAFTTTYHFGVDLGHWGADASDRVQMAGERGISVGLMFQLNQRSKKQPQDTP